ncbi:MAG: hypothetical protein RL161_953 [Bacteroidota bacterium]
MLKAFFFLLFAGLLPTAQRSSAIQVEIQGIKSGEGEVAVLLFHQKEGFPSDHTKAMKKVIVPAKKGVLNLQFDQLPSGAYAISVMHDENRNQKLDANWMGIPKEGYGFSGNKVGLMGPPSFADASLSIQRQEERVTILMRY